MVLLYALRWCAITLCNMKRYNYRSNLTGHAHIPTSVTKTMPEWPDPLMGVLVINTVVNSLKQSVVIPCSLKIILIITMMTFSCLQGLPFHSNTS